jgi:hypothetical protein
MSISFRSGFKGKEYPYDYAEEEIEIITKLSNIKTSKVKITIPTTTKKGVICKAGNKYYTMDNFDDVIQCYTKRNEHGNLFEGTFTPNNRNAKCKLGTEEWYDCYLGNIKSNNFHQIGHLFHKKDNEQI